MEITHSIHLISRIVENSEKSVSLASYDIRQMDLEPKAFYLQCWLLSIDSSRLLLFQMFQVDLLF